MIFEIIAGALSTSYLQSNFQVVIFGLLAMLESVKSLCDTHCKAFLARVVDPAVFCTAKLLQYTSGDVYISLTNTCAMVSCP